VANAAGLGALGDEIDRAAKGQRRRHARVRRQRHRLRNGLLIGLSIVLVIAAAGVGYLYYLTHDLHRQEVHGLQATLTTGQEVGSENILMVGSTSRCALAVQNAAYGLCQGSADSAPVNGVNSDVIMILHVDPAHHRLAILSIPRDLFIPNARAEGADKIDAGLYEGMSQLVAAIEEDFAIPIQHTVSLNFDQFANVVDALGGINMAFPMSVFDAFSGLNVQAAKCVHLNGTQALQVVRARHLQYDAPGATSADAEEWPQENLSDLARIRRDHEFLRVLATAMAKQGLGNPIADLNLIDSVKSDLTFDQTWPVSDMANLVLDFHSVDPNSVPQLTLPVAGVSDPDGPQPGPGEPGDYMYEGNNEGEVEFPAQAQDQAAVDQFLGIGPNINSMTGTPLPAPSSVSVSVMNGTGAYDQATETAAALAALGFHTVGEGDGSPVGDVAETVVYYGSRTPAVEAAAESVVRSITGSVIMAYDPGEVADDAQVTVVTGTQFTVDLRPSAPPSTGGESTAAPVSTATTTAPADSEIAVPSPVTSKLQPWDPRACVPGAVPTAPVPNQL
jgi:LCP family protein required for cell wall assembly